MVCNTRRHCKAVSFPTLAKASLCLALADGLVESPRYLERRRPVTSGAYGALHIRPSEVSELHEGRRRVNSHRPAFLRIAGILISVSGATLSSTGLVVQKMSYMKRDLQGKSSSFALQFCNVDWLWMAGLFLFGLGNVVSWLALGMAENSVLSCFNSFNIIYAMVVAPLWLNEYVSPRTTRCAGILIIGCIWVACLGPRSYRTHTLETVTDLFGQHFFQIIVVVTVIMLTMGKIRHAWAMDRPWTPKDVIQIVSMASIFATYGVLFSKCTSMLVHSSFLTQENQVKNHFFLFAFASVSAGAFQIYFLNECLKKGDVSFIIPTYESMSIALQIVIGGMFFQEYSHFTWLRHLEFWPGVAIVLYGIVMLTRSAEQDKLDGARETSGLIGSDVTCILDGHQTQKKDG